MALFKGVEHLYTFDIVTPLFINFCHIFERHCTPSARPSLLIFHIDHPIAHLLCCTRPLAMVLAFLHWMFLQHHFHPTLRRTRHLVVQNPIILHDNARSHIAVVTDLFHRWQWEILEHPPYSPDMCPFDYDLFAKEPLRGTRYNPRDELIRDIVRSMRNINKDGRSDGVRRLPNIWHKVINKGATILKVHKCCTPVNKAMSEISDCYHYFLFNPSIKDEGAKGFAISGSLIWSITWWNWYLTPVVNFGEVRRAQLAKSTLLTSSLVPLGSFQIF